MVMAAGLGTRLRPLTDILPKPLVPVGDRTALAEVVARVTAVGAPRIVVNAHHRASQVRAAALAEFPGVAISEEHDLLGTAGGLARAARDLGAGDVLVWNVDCLGDWDLDRIVADHVALGGDATLLVQPRARGQGTVGLDSAGKVVRLRGDRTADEATGAHSLGVFVIGASLRARLPPVGCLVADVLIPAMARGANLRAIQHLGSFFDIGTPRSYLEANLAWLERHGPDGHWIGPGAKVPRGLAMDRVIVGSGASVHGPGPIERCIVWPGATAVGPLRGAIVAQSEPLTVA